MTESPDIPASTPSEARGHQRRLARPAAHEGAAIIDEPGLQVPHPRFRERRFVLEPLAEIAPDWKDPVSGRSMKELLRQL